MAGNVKQYVFSKGADSALDEDFAGAKSFGKVKVGERAVFWKSGLRWYIMPVENIRRIFRRVEPVYGKLCCGGRSYLIERLVLVLKNSEELVLHIGDDVQKEAEALLIVLQEQHPDLQYGKV